MRFCEVDNQMQPCFLVWADPFYFIIVASLKGTNTVTPSNVLLLKVIEVLVQFTYGIASLWSLCLCAYHKNT
jgi:hypothetical protein